MAFWRLVILVAAMLLLAAPRPALSSTTYVVRKGDTLSAISKRFHVPAKRIRAENHLRSSKVIAGKKLRIPGKTPAKQAGKSTGKVAAARGPAQVHVVRQGDTLGSISRKYDVSERELLRRNLMKRSKRLRPGTQIVVREELPETYTVREDDTLSEIARKFGMAAEELTVRNDLDSDLLIPGQKLALYERAEEPEPALAGECPFVAEAPVVTEEELRAEARMQPAAPDNAVESPQHRIIRVAKKLLYTPYVWGGTSLTGMDCSGYVWKVFAMVNHNLPRSARAQFQVGKEVERDHLSVGDLVFFQTYAKYPSHVGIYLGDNRFIHASSGSRRVRISSMDQPYYLKRYIGAKRLLYAENDIVN
ncbi:MAG: LysM peptidoglycan-binding domain-containing protein [Deltaproteobacteria bacterium]|nr:LysM peptidoglycan-binding domain-containing protein [Deltaproteobacteria bacterium]